MENVQTNLLSASILDFIPNSGLDFGYCGVLQTSTRTFTIQNPAS